MDLNRLTPAIQRVRTCDPPDARAETYLRTYPSLLAIASYAGVDASTKFLQLATVAYGWMPRILRLDRRHLDLAIAALSEARAATDANWSEAPIAKISKCLKSVVGASKLLHFVNPQVFPIWDRTVERFRLSAAPSQSHMDHGKHYTAYASEVHELRRTSRFSEFFTQFNQAFAERLSRLQISPYCLTEIRAVESAMFELARNEHDPA